MSNYIKVGAGVSTGWQRPSQWLAIPAVGASEEVFYGLHAVWNTTVNPCALLCNGTGAGYTVDWGDGTITNHTFNTKAEKNYVYSSLSSATEFRGYRQAMIKVTPRAGAVINLINIQQRNSSFNYTYLSGWLEIKNNFSVAGASYSSNSRQIDIDNMEFIWTKYLGSNGNATGNYESSSLSKIFIGEINPSLAMFTYLSNTPNLVLQEGDIPSIITNSGSAFISNNSSSDLSWLTLTNLNINMNTMSKLFKFPICSKNHTTLDFAFNNLPCINYIPSINLSFVTTMSNWIFSMTNQIIKIEAYGAKVTHSIANQLLDATNLNSYFTGLGTANSGATLTITGNPGAGTATTSIATSKGWTIIN